MLYVNVIISLLLMVLITYEITLITAVESKTYVDSYTVVIVHVSTDV